MYSVHGFKDMMTGLWASQQDLVNGSPAVG